VKVGIKATATTPIPATATAPVTTDAAGLINGGMQKYLMRINDVEIY